MGIQIETRARKWGSSLGIVLPKEIVEREGIEEGDEITVISVRKRKTAGHLYGALKGWNIDTQKWKDEIRREEREAEERKQRLLSRQLRSHRDPR